jgi:hypothetical protein
MRDKLKILTIGNSFADSLALYFPDVVASVPDCELHFERANHGGCELHRHWKYIDDEERDGVYSMYQDRRWKLREILAREPWDMVSIQQASPLSWRPESFQPFATNIHNHILTHAPQTEVVIQQTWSYREDDPRIMPGGEWAIDQNEMYERLTKNYCALAMELSLRVIPTGYAVQLARAAQSEPFVNYDPALVTSLRWPDLPPQAGSLVGKIYWTKDAASGEMILVRDTTHLNQRGQYLQACVWFAFLYERPTSEISFVPDVIGARDAAFLREIAQQAVTEFPQVAGKRAECLPQ